MIELHAGDARLLLVPETGGAVAAWEVGGIPVFHPVHDPDLAAQHGAALCLYPLVPFSNRIAWGRFRFDGEEHALDRNFGDHPHTIHGNGWMHPWTVLANDGASATLEFAHDPPADNAAEWPFRYRSTITYDLREDGLDIVLDVLNTDMRDQPVGFGVHPYYPRTPIDRMTGDMTLGFEAESVWLNDDVMLPGARHPIDGDWSFDPARPTPAPKIDNCFNGWGGVAEIVWPGVPRAGRRRRLRISAEAPFTHLVVYSPSGKPYVAVEPVTNMNDAVNRPDEPDRNLVTLRPGERLTGRMHFRVDETGDDATP